MEVHKRMQMFIIVMQNKRIFKIVNYSAAQCVQTRFVLHIENGSKYRINFYFYLKSRQFYFSD